MPKGVQKTNREKKKPKADKKKTLPASSPFAASRDQGKWAQNQGGKKAR